MDERRECSVTDVDTVGEDGDGGRSVNVDEFLVRVSGGEGEVELGADGGGCGVEVAEV